jgi:hypothetical protein
MKVTVLCDHSVVSFTSYVEQSVPLVTWSTVDNTDVCWTRQTPNSNADTG